MKFATCLSLLIIAGFAPPASGQTQYPLTHIVVIDQENRTVDNLFGSNSPSNQYYLPELDFATSGQAYTMVSGVKNTFTVQSVPIPLSSVPGMGDSLPAYDYDVDHSHEPGWVSACDAPLITDPSTACAMDGFNHVKIGCVEGVTGCPGTAYPNYAYVQYQDVAPYFQIAAQYAYANRMFQTNQGPSFPSHQFIFGGTSQPGVGDEPTWFVAENITPLHNPNGCIAPPGSTVTLVNPTTQSEGGSAAIYPCFTHNTLADLFAAHDPQITWAYYTPGQGAIWTAPNAISTICTNIDGACTGPYWWPCAVGSNGCIDLNPSDVLTDIGDCNLRQMSWVMPSALESDHAGMTDGTGPSWVASIVNAIGNSGCTDVVNGKTVTYWQDTAIIITWDDWGGWYDHVVPPPVSSKAPAIASSYVYGFRVPLLVVSAYTPAGTVNDNRGWLDFGSILKFIEEVFDLGNISNDPDNPYADYYTNADLSAFFKFGRPPRAFQSIQAPQNEQFFLDPSRPIDPPDND